MEIEGLEPPEQLVLVGLVKLLVHADRELTPAEGDVVTELATKLGRRSWNDTVREAARRFKTNEQLFELAPQVIRTDAQHAIYTWMRKLAGADAITDAEQAILDWLGQVWQLDERPVPEPLDAVVLFETGEE